MLMGVGLDKKSALKPADVMTSAVMKTNDMPRDFIVTSLAAVEAIRDQRGWSAALLCRVAGVSEGHYWRVLVGKHPLTDKTLAKLAAGLRHLQADDLLQSAPPPRVIEVGSEYATIAKGMQRRRMELGLTTEQVDYLAGFTGGHTSKLENWDTSNGRGFGEVSCKLWCDALGVSLAVVEGVVPVATMRMASPIGSQELGRRFDANQRRLEAMRRTMEAKRVGRIGA